MTSKEHQRLNENENNKWQFWGPYLSERQWGTVREDYSSNGDAWNFFPHDHARSRIYRWGEDGIAGISDYWQRLCFAPAFWNGKDTIIKERLYGLTCPEGNHGEDCKELYFYVDNTPTHSYMKYVYKYSHLPYPYQELLNENKNRTRFQPEFEILDTNLFKNSEYFDIIIEYAKNLAEDILIRITAKNRAKHKAPLYILPQIWFRNLWAFNNKIKKPNISEHKSDIHTKSKILFHSKLKEYFFYYPSPFSEIFTENENNTQRLWNYPNPSPFVKDLINDALTQNNLDKFQEKKSGTKFSPIYLKELDAEEEIVLKFRLSNYEINSPLNKKFDDIFSRRIAEADEFYQTIIPTKLTIEEQRLQRQSYAGMLWNKQYYHLDIIDWLNGDTSQPRPPKSRFSGRNNQWETLNNQDIISMPDKWEYPWYAAWDLAFHCLPLARLDMNFAKNQLLLFLKEWYMHPNGQIPAYEWNFSDVNPPVHAWACSKLFKLERHLTQKKDYNFLKRAFHKLCLNFTWWVNRKDIKGKNVFQGGFLGLDNIGIFDRNYCLPGYILEQADGTAWMAMYCLNMLEISLQLTEIDASYADMATKFFEHFALIAESLNNISLNNSGAWDEEDGFFYDILTKENGEIIPLKVRSLVGLTTLFACLCIDGPLLHNPNTEDFKIRMKWFEKYINKQKSYKIIEYKKDNKILLSLVSTERLIKLFKALFSENEFLSDYGIRSLSKVHENGIYLTINGNSFGLNYEPAESTTAMFGGNSNWRGPIWFPMNYMIINALRTYYQFYEEDLKVEFPSYSGKFYNLNQIANMISERLLKIFKTDSLGNKPVFGNHITYFNQPDFKEYFLFYEYFNGNNGQGLGASHQTGWTGIITEIMNEILENKNH